MLSGQMIDRSSDPRIPRDESLRGLTPNVVHMLKDRTNTRTPRGRKCWTTSFRCRSLAAYYQIDVSAGGSNTASAFVVSARITNDSGETGYSLHRRRWGQRVRDARLLSNILKEWSKHFRPLGRARIRPVLQHCGPHWSKPRSDSSRGILGVARTIDHLSREHDVIFVRDYGKHYAK